MEEEVSLLPVYHQKAPLYYLFFKSSLADSYIIQLLGTLPIYWWYGWCFHHVTNSNLEMLHISNSWKGISMAQKLWYFQCISNENTTVME